MELELNLDLIKKGMKVAVALSGGRDSMALFYSLLRKKDELGIELIAVHVEHGIRGEKSVADMEFVKKITEKEGVPLVVKRVDALSLRNEYNSLELAARELRYGVFSCLLKENVCDVVATAHHSGDLTETVFMRILRGTGVRGLAGISAERTGIIRPMLSVTREEIDEFVKQNGIPYCEDETNSETGYTRNFLRNEILPLVKERFPETDKNVARLSKIAAETEEYLCAEAEKVVEFDGVTGSFQSSVPDLIKKYAVRVVMRKFGVFADVEARHCDMAVEIAAANGNVEVDFPFGYALAKAGDRVQIYKKTGEVQGEIALKEGKNFLSGKAVVVEKVEKAGPFLKNGVLFAEIPSFEGLVLRGRREGDRFKRYGGGTKSLGDYFTDEKTPERNRREALLIAKGKDVLVIAGKEISDLVKTNDKSKNLYKITLEVSNNV